MLYFIVLIYTVPDINFLKVIPQYLISLSFKIKIVNNNHVFKLVIFRHSLASINDLVYVRPRIEKNITQYINSRGLVYEACIRFSYLE